MKKIMKTAGVTVLYHPDKKVAGNIRTYAGKLGVLYVLDNTEKPEKSIAAEMRKIRNVKYVAFGRNAGMARALNYAAGEAMRSGYDWLLTMDQDSRADGKTLDTMMNFVSGDVGIVSPRHVTRFDRETFSGDDVTEETAVMTSGNLLNLKAYGKCGPFDERYFIDAVDHEYCLRLKKNGYRILQANRAALRHGWGRPGIVRFLGRNVIVSNHPPLRRYYMVRNTLMMNRDYRKIFPDYCAKTIRGMRKDAVKAVLLEKNRMKKIGYIVLACIDFARGKTGKLSGEIKRGEQPPVAVILVNYNGWKDTLECLASVMKNDYPHYRVYICDNGSRDGSFGRLKKWVKDHGPADNGKVILIRSGKNMGFAGGNNLAIRKAMKDGADHVLLLNNDTIVEGDFITRLVDAWEKEPRAGALGGKIYYYGKRKRIWAAGGGFVNRFTGVSRHFGLDQTDNPGNSRERNLDYLTGCLMLVTREAIRKTGLMDEKYFLYYEESDWQFRMRKQGFRILYVPDSRIYHKVSASSGRDNPVMKYYFVRNRIYFIRKNFGFFFRAIALGWTVCATLARILYHGMSGRAEKSAMLGKALRDGWNGKMGEYRP